MSTWRASIVYTGLVSVAVMLFLGTANDAYAIDYVISDSATCTGLPGGGTSWNGGTLTCSKTSGGHVIITSVDTLTIPAGITLAINSNNHLRNNGGVITNNGLIIITTNRDIENEGVITNNGIINFTSGGEIFNTDTASFTNSGKIESNSTSAGNARITNQDSATFTNTVTGEISLDGTSGSRARILNEDTASFTNSGKIFIEGTGGNSGHLTNQDDGIFDNSGTISIEGSEGSAGRLNNFDTATFDNSGMISIKGTDTNSGRFLNRDNGDFINSGIISIEGTNDQSAQIRNEDTANITNSGTVTITGVNDNSGQLRNENDAIITNSGTITIIGVNDNSGQLRNNDNGLIVNNCGEITFVSISGNPIQEEEDCETLPLFGTSNAYEDPTIGKTRNGKQVVENGICIDINCWTVSADFHQDFELVEMLSDSIHTITTTVFCQNGVNKCNYVAFGVSPYGTNINESVWKIILQKDHRDNWTMKVIDPNVYLGEVTSTTQIVNDNRYLAASATIEFKKPTPGMILNVEVRDSGGGYRDFKFNDGVEIIDAYAYPSVETSYEPNLEIKPLCLNENPNKRYTCAFDKIREWTIKNAEAALKQIPK